MADHETEKSHDQAGQLIAIALLVGICGGVAVDAGLEATGMSLWVAAAMLGWVGLVIWDVYGHPITSETLDPQTCRARIPCWLHDKCWHGCYSITCSNCAAKDCPEECCCRDTHPSEPMTFKVPKHDCEYFSDPEAGHCDFCAACGDAWQDAWNAASAVNETFRQMSEATIRTLFAQGNEWQERIRTLEYALRDIARETGMPEASYMENRIHAIAERALKGESG